MKTRFESALVLGFFVIGLCGGLFGMGADAMASNNTRVSNPNSVNVELGGRGLLYTFSYDRVLSDELSVGFGFGTVPMNDLFGNTTNVSATIVPLYLSYYFMREAGSLFATAGASLVANSSSVSGLKTSVGGLQLSSTPLLPTAGVGYEFRSDPGFLVRVAGYLILGQTVAPWGGFSIGYSF